MFKKVRDENEKGGKRRKEIAAIRMEYV